MHVGLPPIQDSINQTISLKEAQTEKTGNLIENSHLNLNTIMKRSFFHRSLSKNGFQRFQQAEKIAFENDRMAKKLLKVLVFIINFCLFRLKVHR